MNDKSDENWVSMSDKALGELIGNFIKQNRLDQNKSQELVSELAGISRSTLGLLEKGEKVTLSTLIQVLRVLDLLYIMSVFKMNDEISPLEYARLKKNIRKKSSGKRIEKKDKEDLGW